MAIKYSKNLLWLKPFVECAGKHVPINRLKYIRGYKLPLNKDPKAFATLATLPGGYFQMNIRTNTVDVKTLKNGTFKPVKHREMYLAVMLDTLAHELAHIKHWDHSPEHFILQSKIMVDMGKMLQKLQVPDTYVRCKKYKKTLSKKEE